MSRKILLLGLGFCALSLAWGCSTSTEQENDGSEEAAEEQAEAKAAVEEGETDEGEAGQAQAGDEGDQADEGPGAPRAELWSDDGLDTQDRMDQLREEARQSDMEQEPESTPWETSEREVPDELAGPDGEGAQTPGALLFELASELRLNQGLGAEVWEQTARVLSEDDEQAVGVIMQWGFKDDSLAGSDLRVHMERGDEGWVVAEMEERFHCRRGVTDDGMCL